MQSLKAQEGADISGVADAQKGRTPSGNVISVNFGDIRNLFSPDRYCVKQNGSKKAACLKVNQPLKQRLRNTKSRSSEDQGKQMGIAKKVKKQDIKTTPKRISANNIAFEESDRDFYFTPPATPIRMIKAAEPIDATSKEQTTIKGAAENTISAVANPLLKSEQPINLERDMEIEQETVKSLDLPVVMEMFRKINERLSVIEGQTGTTQPHPEQVTQVSDLQETVIQQQEEIKKLKRENFLLDRASKVNYMKMEDLSDRIARLELTANKKMVAISGLYIYCQKKEDVIKEVEAFFDYELSYFVKLDDVFLLGGGNPPLVIVVFSTLQDKVDVMNKKSMLKDVRNKDNKKIFINDYWPSETNEKRKRERDVYTSNEGKPAEYRQEMTFKNGNLLVNSKPLKEVQPIHTPNTIEILDMEVNYLNYILKLIVNRGKEHVIKDSRFIGYTAQVHDYEMIQQMYLKIKLIHPTAHHVICAYRMLESPADVFTSGYCDDGEHGAGKALLDHIIERGYMNRVIFIVRYYGGTKLYADRFTAIIRTAEYCYVIITIRQNHERIRMLNPASLTHV